MASLSRALISSSQYPVPPSRSSRSIITSNLQNMPPSIDHRKWRAAPYESLVSSPPDSAHLPTELHRFTDRFEDLHDRRLKEVKHVVGTVEKGSLESLVMLDAIQRLGIGYHFEEETKSILQEQHVISADSGRQSRRGSLYEVALRFRLLRQEGYYVPADIFEGFKSKEDNNGGFAFDRKLYTDVAGLTSLYEASLLSIHGEDILDEAATFSHCALIGWEDRSAGVSINDINGTSSQTLRELVKNTLSNPFHRSLPRFTSKGFQAYFNGPYKWTEAFRELAVLDSDLVASINRSEILQVSKWWRDLGLAKELKFARDQPLKWYTWPMAILTDPKLSQERVDLTKCIAMVYIIDDIFDVYGSVNELGLFTEAIKRWECMEELPDYMKACFMALHDITNEISFNIYKKRGWDPTDLLRKSWMSLFDAFLVEARWFNSGHSPSADEYLNNAIVTTGVPAVMAHSFAHLCEGTSGQSLDMLNGCPRIFSSTAKILRLCDDLGSAKDENQEGHDGSYVDYYMKENPSCSLEGARDLVKEMISDSWKSLNQECLFNRPFSPSMAKASLDTARMVPLMYDYDENGGLSRIEEYMKSLLLSGSVVKM